MIKYKPLSDLSFSGVMLKSTIFKLSGYVAFILLFAVSFISLNHIVHILLWLRLSTLFLGWLCLLTLVFSIIYAGRYYLREVLSVFILFFFVGYFLGPYLEPPADPLEHLRRVYSYCGLSSQDLPISNRGFWHYSMSGIFLCNESLVQTPEATLRSIDFIHGLYQGLLLSILFIMGRHAGLPARWSFFATVVAFLFFGTNKFSFFSYYSLAASASSMMIYWLWISLFFFKKTWFSLLYGMMVGVLCLPILWVNHKQEAAFLGFVLMVWVLMYIHMWVWKQFSHVRYIKRHSVHMGKIIYLFILLMIFFVIPQVPQLYEWMSGTNNDLMEDVAYKWRTNHYLFLDWIPFYKVGDFIGYRVGDSLGVMGFLPVLFIAPLILGNSIKPSIESSRIVAISLFPLIVLFIPLFSVIWITSLNAATAGGIYWRIVYSSVYWLALASVLFKYEHKIFLFFLLVKKVVLNILKTPKVWLDKEKKKNNGSKIVFIISFLTLIFLASFRTSPLYGKLDFITIDSRSWWKHWEGLVAFSYASKFPVYSDDITSIMLSDVFNIDIASKQIDSGNYRPLRIPNDKLDLKSMRVEKNYACVINLRGFVASWVPQETGHWDARLSNTSLQYQLDGITGKELKSKLATAQFGECLVYQ